MVLDVFLPAAGRFLGVRIRVGGDARPAHAEEVGDLINGLFLGARIGGCGDDCVVDR